MRLSAAPTGSLCVWEGTMFLVVSPGAGVEYDGGVDWGDGADDWNDMVRSSTLGLAIRPLHVPNVDNVKRWADRDVDVTVS